MSESDWEQNVICSSLGINKVIGVRTRPCGTPQVNFLANSIELYYCWYTNHRYLQNSQWSPETFKLKEWVLSNVFKLRFLISGLSDFIFQDATFFCLLFIFFNNTSIFFPLFWYSMHNIKIFSLQVHCLMSWDKPWWSIPQNCLLKFSSTLPKSLKKENN